MSYKKFILFSNPKNYGGKRSSSSIKYIVYHYTANKTDRAKSNANYFKNNVVNASAHFFVDDTDVYQSVPDLNIAYAVGGKKYPSCKTTGGGEMYGKITNLNSISIEMCSVNGEISEATMTNAATLGKELMKKYNIPISNVYRHFDCNGKLCPGWNGWYGKNDNKWTYFLKKIQHNKVTNDSENDIKTSINNTKNDKTFKVKLLDDLNIRKTPNGEVVKKNGAKKGTIYTIVETSGTWGKLKSGVGWISISEKYVKRIS